MNSFLISNINAKGPGFGLFSLTHFVTLIFLALLSFFIIKNYKKATPKKRNKIRIIIASSILASEIIRDIVLFVTHQFTLGDWPFQLCGIGIFIVLYDAWRQDKTGRELMYSLTLPGALAAIITPDWVRNSIVNLFVWQSFLLHTLLVTYVLMQLIAKDFRPNPRELWRVVIFLLAIVPFTEVLNHAWHQNFFFLEIPVPGSPLAPIHAIFGHYYLLGMILLMLFVWLLIYLPWQFSNQKLTLKKAKKVE
jgi:hypothetical integral membrane protein (TIGR02206 family)